MNETGKEQSVCMCDCVCVSESVRAVVVMPNAYFIVCNICAIWAEFKALYVGHTSATELHTDIDKCHTHTQTLLHT